MTRWENTTLGCVCRSVSETYHGQDSNVVLVNTSDVFEGEILAHEYVPNVKLRGQFKKTFQKDDILFSEIRPANKRYAYVTLDDTRAYIASTKLMVLRANREKIIPRYLYSFLKSEQILAELQHLAETRSGTFPQITFDAELAPLKIILPAYDTQKKIVDIISVFDDKIALNRKINKNLEEQVSAIYQAWFEDFSCSDGIRPYEWTMFPLADIADVTSGKRPPVKSTYQTKETPIPILGASSIMGFTSVENYSDHILVIGRVGTHGIVQRFNGSCWASDNTLVIRSKFYEYVNQILQRVDYHAMNRGSTQPLITQSDIKNVAVLLPDHTTLSKFEKIAASLMAVYESNLLESTKLIALRDTLLPRLMSGELDVSSIKL